MTVVARSRLLLYGQKVCHDGPHDAQRAGGATNTMVSTGTVRGWSTLPVTVA